MIASAESDRVQIIEPLRGLAALAVMWFHFVYAGNLFIAAEGLGVWLRASGTHGGLGVEVFFVISGFILPYSMHKRRYRIGDLGTFVLKRVIRLDPPYLVNVAMCLTLWLAVSLVADYRGERFHFDWLQFALHLGYLNAIFEQGWYNPVYWTLAIEFQYYLLLALLFPLLVHANRELATATPIFLAMVPFAVPQHNLVFSWLGLFALGMVAFQFYCGLSAHFRFFASVLLIFSLIWITLGGLIAAVGLTTAMAIVFVRIPKTRPLSFLGAISYSLYLVHWPLGSRFINLGARIADSNLTRCLVLGVSIVITIWTAYLFYIWVERPAQRWSSAISYRGDKQKA